MENFTQEPESRPSVDGVNQSGLRGIGLIRWLGVGLLLVAGLVTIQNLLRPAVDESQTQPVVISYPELAKPENDPNAVAEPSLPENCLTAQLNQATLDNAAHPLVPLLAVAKEILASIDTNIRDYTATLNSQVFVDGQLQPEKYLRCKIRHAQRLDDGTEIPFSVYTNFLSPQESAGQEVVWIQGQNGGKLIAHGTGLLNVKRVYLDPEGTMAMKGNRYPIGEIGFRNLIAKIVNHGDGDLQHPECRVTVTRGIDINGRTCSLFEVSTPKNKPTSIFIWREFTWTTKETFRLLTKVICGPRIREKSRRCWKNTITPTLNSMSGYLTPISIRPTRNTIFRLGKSFRS